MPRRSDIERQMAELQAQLDSAESDDEVWIKEADGPEIKVSGNRASKILSRYSKLWEDEGGEGEGEGGEGEGGEGEQDPKPAGGGYFGKRKS